jgi:mono/diheme cytochrome c family protein
VPGKYAPPGYQSDMPEFGSALSDDEIWAVLAYIASRWSPRARAHQASVTREAGARR